MSGTLETTAAPGRLTVRLRRPEVRNAIDAGMVAEWHDVLDELERDPRILVVAGLPGVFASGADIRELRERGREDALASINSGLFRRIRALPLPTLAAIDGHALGAGAELAYACDLRVATRRLRIGNPEVALGILAAAGAAWRLRELVGEPLAKDMLFTGRVLDSDEALAVRLVNEVVEEDGLDAAVDRWVVRLAAGAPLALRLTKLAVDAPPSAHPAIDDLAQAVLFETEEKERRMSAFLDRTQRRGATP